MFLKNWYKLLGEYFSGSIVKPTIKTAAGTDVTIVVSQANLQFASNYSHYSCPSMYNVRDELEQALGGVVFGDGNTPVTVDDYTLSGNVITGLSASAGVSIENTEEYTEYTAVYTIPNTGSEDITIKEIGLFFSTQQSSALATKILIERTVLDEPLTIPAGGVGQITYTIKLAYPTE